MGRSRGHEQLVGVERNPRRLQGARHLVARRPRVPRLPRDVSDARKHRRARPGLPYAELWPASRRLHAGRAHISRPQSPEPANHLLPPELFYPPPPLHVPQPPPLQLPPPPTAPRL